LVRTSSGFFSLKKKGDLVGWVSAGSGNAGVRSGKSQRLAVVTARGDPLHLWSRALESVKIDMPPRRLKAPMGVWFSCFKF
jgi:hypothetical protein